MKSKLVSVLTCTSLLFALSVQSAFAHVVIKPAEVGVGQSTSFVMGVPTEKNIPTTGVRLIIPEGLQYVRPLVKPGWKVEMKKSGEGESARVTEISWTGGAIPVDQKDEFVISAKAPSQKTTLTWKAYQTYSDGTIVTWDQPPKAEGEPEDESKGPYSQTKIIDDLKATPSSTSTQTSTGGSNGIREYVSYIALSISIVAFIVAVRKTK